MKKNIIRKLLRIPFFILILVGVWFLLRYKILIYLVGKEAGTTEIAFQNVEVIKETKQIEMQYKVDGEMNAEELEQIKKTYKSLEFMIFDKNWMPFQDYGLSLTFSCGDEEFHLKKSGKTSSETLIRNTSSFSVLDIATYFSDATILYIEKFPYSEITDFDGFHNLKFLYYAFDIPYKDEKYLTDHFDGLSITDSYVQSE